MSDITVCVNRECPMREDCYRFKDVPDLWQRFAYFIPAGKDDYTHCIPLKKMINTKTSATTMKRQQSVLQKLIVVLQRTQQYICGR